MNIEVLTPDKTLFEGQADVITLPGVTGSFQLLDNHAPMIANLGKGQLTIGSKTKSEFTVEVNGGLVEVVKNKVVVLV